MLLQHFRHNRHRTKSKVLRRTFASEPRHDSVCDANWRISVVDQGGNIEHWVDAHEEMDLIGFPAAFNEGATPIRENLPEGSRKASRIWGVKTYASI